MDNLTPAMRQYMEIKGENEDAILFFRMGDFYEMFFDDAVAASRVLGIALTSRDRDRDIPMCGVPYHAASGYVAKLVRAGYRVAICEQVEDPGEAKGIVRRAVSRVITPGVAFDDELLEPKANNFIASLFDGGRRIGLSYMDVSTGEFFVTEVQDSASLLEELRRIRPLEIVVPSSFAVNALDGEARKVTELEEHEFSYSLSLERLTGHFMTHSLDGFGCSGLGPGVRAAGALLNYVKETQKSGLDHIRKCTPYFTCDFLVLDHGTRRNLEVTQNLKDGTSSGTILELLDCTRTAMGARRLKSWLLQPLKDAPGIVERLDAVSELFEARDRTARLQEHISGVQDLERLSSRVSMGIASPRDLVSLRSSLEVIPPVREELSALASSLLKSASASLDDCPEAASLIGTAIVDSPPPTVRDGGVIREGYSGELDELRCIGASGKDWIVELESRERRRTGINTLKVGYNRVFGYYIEVTRTNLGSVPPDYTRKQTLVGAERFVTGELKEWEEKILSASEKAKALEAALFKEVVDEVRGYTGRILSTSSALSTVDAAASFAHVSFKRNYVRPEVNEGVEIRIEGGRHPVVEASVEGFISNDLSMGGEIIVLTGPNMAGKSTYLRQNALIVLMAQAGCFVPAEKAVVGVVDRIFTRVGASDDLSRGQSTFMVEMNEVANILNNATPRSLIILDEVGRGTSTFDGLSIAWATVEHLHDSPSLRGAKTLFATHYHELTELSLTRERVRNYNMAVRRWNDRVIFLRKVVPGGASSSYGIQVAKLAGLPEGVIERAEEILRNLEKGELAENGLPRIARTGPAPGGQMSLLGEKDPLREELKKTDVNTLTPVDALLLVERLKGMTPD